MEKKLELTNQAHQPCNQPEITDTDILSECVSLMSYATSQETQRLTDFLHVFFGLMICHTTSDETQRQTHQLDVFLGLMVSHATSQET